jgi:hypothetical protein
MHRPNEGRGLVIIVNEGRLDSLAAAERWESKATGEHTHHQEYTSGETCGRTRDHGTSTQSVD